MTVYKYFLKTAFRHKWIIIGYASIFFILSLLNGTNTEGRELAFMEASMDIGIVDKSDSDLSRELVDYLKEKNNVTTMKDDLYHIKEQIFLEIVDAVVIIPDDFLNKVVNKQESVEIFRDDRKMGPIQVENEINKFLAFSNASFQDNSFDLEKVRNALNREVEVEIVESANATNNKRANIWFKYYFNFVSYVIIAIYVAVIGLIMVDFNDKNIQDRTKISSKKFLSFNTEMYLGQVTIGIIITTTFILGSVALKGKHLGEINFFKYVLNTGVFSIAMLCFVFLINNLTSSKFVINGISTVASLGTAFISGVFVEQEFLSETVLNIAKFFPTYYFVRINEMTVASFSDMGYELFMQILFGAAFLAIGLYFSKIKQKT